MSSCQVSVILPVYNGDQFVAKALDSATSQEVQDMEVLVIDDGSTDASLEIISRNQDPRVHVLHQENQGLARTLNKGISLAQGEFIARQDQDDIILSNRISKQLAYFVANPEYVMCGTWTQIYSGDSPTKRFHKHPCTNESLQLELLFDNPFVHSSMMIRTQILRDIGGYCEDKSRQPPEDYELWSRIARKYQVANLPEVLTIYREVPGSMSRTGDNPFLFNVIRISSENIFHNLRSVFTVEDCTALANLYHRGGAAGFKPGITKAKARQMLELAAENIAGHRMNWSPEFKQSYARMRAHLDSRFLRRLIPNQLLVPARWLRDRLKRRGRPI